MHLISSHIVSISMPSKYTYEFIIEKAKEHEAEMLVSKEDYDAYYVEHKGNLPFRCRCGKEYTSSARTWKGRCRSCGAKKGMSGRLNTKVVTYQDFVDMLVKHGWTMISSSEEYKNTKTLMKVMCSEGHEGTSRYNHFEQGFRCKRCADGEKKNTEEDADQVFLSKGFTPLESYIDGHTPRKCKCDCGNTCYLTLSNARKNISGCKTCVAKSQRVPWLNMEAIIERQGCIPLFKEKDYTNNATKLKFICCCGNLFICTWKQFMLGTRCKYCADDSRKETCMKKYGVEYPMQCPEIYAKNAASSYKKKLYKLPSGKKIFLQGYEGRALDQLLKTHQENEICYQFEIDEEGNIIKDILHLAYTKPNGRPAVYYPDFYIPASNTIVEVKSMYTYVCNLDVNEAKFAACVDQGYEVLVLIYDEKRLLRELHYSPSSCAMHFLYDVTLEEYWASVNSSE